MKKIHLILLIIIIFSSLFSLEVPRLKGRVNDYANILISGDEANLESILKQIEEKTSSQIALLTIPSLEGEALEAYSIKVADQWGLGQKDRDNGILLLVAMQEKQLRLEVGYGLEPLITDAKSGYIIREIIVPEFKKGNYYQGIASGLLITGQIITNEYNISDEELAAYEKKQTKSKRPQIPFGFLIFLFMMFFGGIGRRRRGGLLPLLLLGSMMGGGRSSSRGSGFGGFSGGGGGFGGGGASGGW